MKAIRHNKYWLLLIITILSCSDHQSYYLKQANIVLSKQKKEFGKDSNKENLLNHFPEKIISDSVSFHAYPPSCPPSYECGAQFGEVVFIVNKADYQKELSEISSREIAYKTFYTDSNIIINLTELRSNNILDEKINKWYSNKLPIPYFEDFNFGLGKTKKNAQNNYTYSIPIDLQVYVIQAEAGDFWKINCNEKRPASLKEWQHGYSKGFAISEKEDIIVYWTMIW